MENLLGGTLCQNGLHTCRKVLRWSTPSGLDVPAEDILHEGDADQAHGPSQVFGPGVSDRRDFIDGDH